MLILLNLDAFSKQARALHRRNSSISILTTVRAKPTFRISISDRTEFFFHCLQTRSGNPHPPPPPRTIIRRISREFLPSDDVDKALRRHLTYTQCKYTNTWCYITAGKRLIFRTLVTIKHFRHHIFAQKLTLIIYIYRVTNSHMYVCMNVYPSATRLFSLHSATLFKNASTNVNNRVPYGRDCFPSTYPLFQYSI
jgi:hypothetical protein